MGHDIPFWNPQTIPSLKQARKNSGIGIAGRKPDFHPEKTRIFAGTGFSVVKPVAIDGQLNFMWKSGIEHENCAKETKVMSNSKS